jgi:hypothetical protein
MHSHQRPGHIPMTLIRNILAKQHQCRSAATTADFAGDPFRFQRWAHLTEMYQKFDLTNPEMLRDSPTSAHLTTTTAQELCFLPHTSTGDEIPTHYPVQQDHAMTGTTGDSPRFETPTCLHRHKPDINLESHTRINPQAPMVNSNHTDHRRPTPHDIMLSWGLTRISSQAWKIFWKMHRFETKQRPSRHTMGAKPNDASGATK